MNALVWIPVAIVAAAAMEPWSAFAHGRIWHGGLWRIHRSHHRKRKGRLEANDALSALHAPIAVALIVYACRASPGVLRDTLFGVGVGMSAFGISYFVVHDGLVHGRLPVAWLARVRWLARIRDAHLEHHKKHRAPYGLFLGPREIARERRRATQGETS